MTLVIYDMENIKKASGALGETSRTNFKFDFKKLKDTIENKFPDTVFSHAVFMAIKTEGEERFANALRYMGYYVTTKRAREKTSYYEGRRYKYKDNDMDAYIVSFTERFSNNYDNVIIVSGDGDLEPVITHARDKGKYVCVVGWKDNMSGKLKKYPHLYIDEWQKQIEFKGEENE